jgi:hypothetical protein
MWQAKYVLFMYHCYFAHAENTALYSDRLCIQGLTGCDAVNKDRAFLYCMYNWNTVYLTPTSSTKLSCLFSINHWNATVLAHNPTKPCTVPTHTHTHTHAWKRNCSKYPSSTRWKAYGLLQCTWPHRHDKQQGNQIMVCFLVFV